MQIVFSGSRRGATLPQEMTFVKILSGLLTIAASQEPVDEPLLFRHGDCVGWDATAHSLAKAAGYGIIIHPAAVAPHLRAFCQGALLVMEPKPPLERNRDMADLSERAIICPNTPEYRVQSGTWYTWKYATRKGIDACVIRPDGSTHVTVGVNKFLWP